MIDESVNNVKEKTEETATAETPPEDSDAEAPARPVSAEELVKEIKDKDVARIIAELLRGQQFASVYIDARSGGVFFGGEARITGDVVGRGQVKRAAAPVSGALAEASAGQVLSEDLAKVGSVYIAPSLYTRAQQILAEKHVLILWGQAHWGKWTTALHLLSAFHAEEIFEINPDVNLEELRSSELESNKRGYAIDTLAPDSAENLNTFVLNHLSRQLRKQHSHLVVTVDSRVLLSKEALSGYLVVWSDVPDRALLLEKHLAWYLTDKDRLAKALELSQTDTVQQLLSTHVLPGEVDRLAELLAGVARSELNLEEALARFEARARQQVETWFETHADLEGRTFMLSVAVFNGANYQAVVEADERLQSLIKPPPSEGEPPKADSVFRSTRGRVEEAYAHPVQGYEEAEFGRSPVELIVLDNPAFQPAVLHYAWHEYDRLRRPLLAWLRDLGFHPSFDVRARAAAAVGELSKYNFGYVRGEVLLSWANHQDSRARAAAALALGIPAWEGEFAPQVLGLLHHWSTLRNNWRLCWTAAAAYGGLVGLRFPDTALRDLHLIANAEDLRLFGVLSRSVTNLFEAGRLVPDYYLKVLNALVAWTADLKVSIVALTGLLIFLNLALESRVEADPEGGVWPTLLWLAREDDAYRHRVASLWHRALNAKAAQKLALETLRQWLQILDDDTRLDTSMEQIIVLATQGNDRERRRLCFYLDRWASHPKEKSKSAARILSALSNGTIGAKR